MARSEPYDGAANSERSRWTRLRPTLIVAALWVGACSETADARGPFAIVVDPASRHGFRYAQHRESKLWVHLHCELRVPLARALPDPLHTEETGDLLSFTRFNPGSMGSAGIAPSEFKERDGYRVWLYREVALESDFDGAASLGVQAHWPDQPNGPARFEPSESFALPALNSMRPYVWTDWRRADEIRGGPFADWEKVHQYDAAAAPPMEHPYELRCRPVLTEHLYVPLEREDPNVNKPDPRDPPSPG